MNYVLGFAFAEYPLTPGVFYVALIKKQTPDWQKDKTNGIGGKIETQNHGNGLFMETEHEAMVREFKEETGVETDPASWLYFADMEFPGAKVACFTSQMEWEKFNELKTTAPDEGEVLCIRIDRVSEFNPIPNLAWLVPMAKFFLANGSHPALQIVEQDFPACGLSCEP